MVKMTMHRVRWRGRSRATIGGEMKNALVSAIVAAIVSTALFYTLPRATGGGAPPASMVDVPNLAGLTPDQANQLLGPRGLVFELIEQVEDARYRPGVICQQQPLDASRVPRGSTVRAKVAKAIEKVRVPALVGRPGTDAQAALEAAHLKVGTRAERPDDKAAPGSVLSTTPPAEAEVAPGTAVDILTAAALMLPVPKVTGRGLGGAKDAITKAGFTVGEVKYTRDEDSDSGIVLRQTPAAQTPAPKGSKIDLAVNYTD
jgi:serine/threonine-protein kinase